MARRLRKKLFVDSSVQGALILRTLLYWVCCLLFIIIPLLIGQTVIQPERFFFEQFGDLWHRYWLFFTAATLMLPFVLYDVLKLSNRFAGPLLRLRREMRRLGDGEKVEPLHFRENDYWQDLATSFNKVINLIDRAEATELAQNHGEDHADPHGASHTTESQLAGAVSNPLNN